MGRPTIVAMPATAIRQRRRHNLIVGKSALHYILRRYIKNPFCQVRAINSAARVPPLQGGSQGFESLIAHYRSVPARDRQSTRMPDFKGFCDIHAPACDRACVQISISLTSLNGVNGKAYPFWYHLFGMGKNLNHQVVYQNPPKDAFGRILLAGHLDHKTERPAHRMRVL